jgi:hypothetical protein
VKTRIVITMDGGIVQNIIANHGDVEIALIDYDIDSMEEDRLTEISQGDGTKEKAYAWVASAPDGVDSQRVDQLFQEIAP